MTIDNHQRHAAARTKICSHPRATGLSFLEVEEGDGGEKEAKDTKYESFGQ